MKVTPRRDSGKIRISNFADRKLSLRSTANHQSFSLFFREGLGWGLISLNAMAGMAVHAGKGSLGFPVSASESAIKGPASDSKNGSGLSLVSTYRI